MRTDRIDPEATAITLVIVQLLVALATTKSALLGRFMRRTEESTALPVLAERAVDLVRLQGATPVAGDSLFGMCDHDHF